MRSISSFPTVGLHEINFSDQFDSINRKLIVWYPIAPSVQGNTSKSNWAVYREAINAKPIESKSKMAVIVLSHGFNGNPYQLSWLTLRLIQCGFIVIAMQHRDFIDQKIQVNYWKRARDISMMIDVFSKDSLANFADLNRIGIVGYSLGGTTALWIAGGRTTKLDSLIPEAKYAAINFRKADLDLSILDKEKMAQDWKDKRVKSVFAMAPGWSWIFDEISIKNISIPIYFIAGSQDTVFIPNTNAGWFASHIPNAYYQEILGDDHFIFISGMHQTQKNIDREWIQSQVADEACRFFMSTL